MKTIVTVVGKDQVGIIASVSQMLANENINILDIDQSILDGYFNMFMIVDMTNSKHEFQKVVGLFDDLAKQIGVSIQLQRADLFEEMYRITGGNQ
ncbi:ACT domain-containing protein [Erysipelothrix urinaevulpis]|uniref:ACT domain-containing protein n=1 Tax=Erysipelothrix urinaevulpis TaxID=2683717 RepID=UPI0013594D37|nr:ACT domain-containing protein [Erysipelothrix urinaevulpis]